MKPLFLYLSLLVSAGVFSQENNKPIPSTVEDSSKAASILMKVSTMPVTDFVNAEKLTSDALTIALAIKNNLLTALCYETLAYYERRLRTPQLLRYDSLALSYYRKTNKQRFIFNVMDKYAQDLLIMGYFEKAKVLLQAASKLAEDAGDKNFQGQFYSDWGIYYCYVNQLKEATSYHQKSLEIFTLLKNESMQVFSKRWLARVSIYDGNINDKMLDYLYEAIHYYASKNNLSDQALCYDILGYAFQVNGNIEKALSYYIQSRDLFRKDGYTIKVIDEDFTLGEVYIEKQKPDSSRFYLDEAEKLSRAAGYEKGIAAVKAVRIELLTAEKKYAEAEKMADTANKANALVNRKEIDVIINEYMAKVKSGRGNADSAVYYSLKKMAALKASNPPEVLSKIIDDRLKRLSVKDQDAVNGLKKLWNMAGTDSVNKALMRGLTGKEYAAVMKTFSTTDIVYDSNLVLAEQQQLVNGEVRYKTRQVKDSLTIAQQQSIIQDQKLSARNRWLLVAAAMILFAGLFTVQQFRYRKKAEADKKTIERYQEELIHRDDNQFAKINSIVRMTGETSTDADSFSKLSFRLMALNKLRSLIYQNNPGQVNLHDYLASLSASYNTIYAPGEIALHQQETILLPAKKAEKIGLIVNEIITNAFKHAFTDEAKAMVTINLSVTEKGAYLLHIADNGKGIVNAGQHGSGMEIISGLTEEIDGTLKQYNREGAHFEILFM